MLVKLTYFKPNGKFYTSAEYQSISPLGGANVRPMFVFWQEVDALRKQGKLPGLIAGHSEYHVLVDIPAHPNNHPHLLVADPVPYEGP